jgi:lipid II:glycine glycyltransferase (peptidoglycan interpeptide bridge formation enzyme)
VQRDQQVFSVHAVLQREQKAYGLLIGTTQEGYQEGIPSYINYETIMYLQAHNFTYFNFGGVSLDQTHKGLSTYKDSMGTVKTASYYGSTNFLTFPHKLVNPLMNLARSLPENRLIKVIQHRI